MSLVAFGPAFYELALRILCGSVERCADLQAPPFIHALGKGQRLVERWDHILQVVAALEQATSPALPTASRP